jgi:hypothetical protein
MVASPLAQVWDLQAHRQTVEHHQDDEQDQPTH